MCSNSIICHIGSNFRLNLTHVLDTSKYFYIFHIFGDNLVFQFLKSNYFLCVVYQNTYVSKQTSLFDMSIQFLDFLPLVKID